MNALVEQSGVENLVSIVGSLVLRRCHSIAALNVFESLHETHSFLLRERGKFLPYSTGARGLARAF